MLVLTWWQFAGLALLTGAWLGAMAEVGSGPSEGVE